MVAAYLILIVITITLYAIFWRTGKEKFDIAGIITGAVAMVVAMIGVNTADSSSTGFYIYYINGVRVSSGFMKATTFLVLLIMFGGISITLTRGIGYMIGHKRDAATKAKAKVWVLVLSIAGVQFGSTLFFTGISELTKTTTPNWRHYLVVVLGIAIFVWSIWGIISFVRKKRAGR